MQIIQLHTHLAEDNFGREVLRSTAQRPSSSFHSLGKAKVCNLHISSGTPLKGKRSTVISATRNFYSFRGRNFQPNFPADINGISRFTLTVFKCHERFRTLTGFFFYANLNASLQLLLATLTLSIGSSAALHDTRVSKYIGRWNDWPISHRPEWHNNPDSKCR